jgi:hypothetical protein
MDSVADVRGLLDNLAIESVMVELVLDKDV